MNFAIKHGPRARLARNNVFISKTGNTSVTCPGTANVYRCDPANCSKYYQCVYTSDTTPLHRDCAGGTYCNPGVTTWSATFPCILSTCMAPPPTPTPAPQPEPVTTTTQQPPATTTEEVSTTAEESVTTEMETTSTETSGTTNNLTGIDN